MVIDSTAYLPERSSSRYSAFDRLLPSHRMATKSSASSCPMRSASRDGTASIQSFTTLITCCSTFWSLAGAALAAGAAVAAGSLLTDVQADALTTTTARDAQIILFINSSCYWRRILVRGSGSPSRYLRGRKQDAERRSWNFIGAA